MDTISKLKLAVFEASNEKLIDNDFKERVISFCESADLYNPNDVDTLKEITDCLITITESANDTHIDDDKSELISEIFESCSYGEITEDERDILLNMIGK